MSARAMMLIGAACGIFAGTLSLCPITPGTIVFVVFAAGTLFGMGLGIWEERLHAPKPEKPTRN